MIVGVTAYLRVWSPWLKRCTEAHRWKPHIGVKVVMATGAEPLHATSLPVGIDSTACCPDKVEMVRELQSQGHTVAMLGDGVMTCRRSTAQIGVAMGAGSPATIETAVSR